MGRWPVIVALFFLTANLLCPSNSEGAGLAEAEQERRIGNLLDLYMTGTFVVLKDDDLVNNISEITRKILSSTDSSEIKLHTRIINDPLPIASSFPGYLYISTGMLDLLENRDELAAVISHAIAHVIAKDQYHAYRAIERYDGMTAITAQIVPLVTFAGLIGAGIAGAALTPVTAKPILAGATGSYVATGMHSTFSPRTSARDIPLTRLGPYLFLSDRKLNMSALEFFEEIYSGYSKDDEIRADTFTVNSLRKAGFDAGAFSSLLERLACSAREPGGHRALFHFMAASPGLGKRIENAQEHIKNIE